MRNLILMLLCLTLSPLTALAADPDDAPLKKVAKDVATAWNGGDASAMAANYASDAVVTFSSGLTVRGQKDIQNTFAHQFEDSSGARMTLSGDEFQFLGSDAAVWRRDWKVKGGHSHASTTVGTALSVLTRSAAGWRIQEELLALSPEAPIPAKKQPGGHGHSHGPGGHEHDH